MPLEKRHTKQATIVMPSCTNKTHQTKADTHSGAITRHTARQHQSDDPPPRNSVLRVERPAEGPKSKPATRQQVGMSTRDTTASKAPPLPARQPRQPHLHHFKKQTATSKVKIIVSRSRGGGGSKHSRDPLCRNTRKQRTVQEPLELVQNHIQRQGSRDAPSRQNAKAATPGSRKSSKRVLRSTGSTNKTATPG